jgi:serine/threonine-protein kinase
MTPRAGVPAVSGGTAPPGPYGPAPGLAPAVNPYQSQIVPPGPYPQHAPPYPAAPPSHPGGPPTPPQLQTRKTERGTLPAIPAAAPTMVSPPAVAPSMAASRATSGTLPVSPTHTGPFPAPNASRIMVQYPQVGSKLTGPRGTYDVRDVIGSGEFGAVYECIGPFDQIYAVKMVRPSNRPYSDVHAEWAREVQRLFSLRHPNVVYIYDAFAQDHLFYLALERCDHPLKEMLGSPMQEGLVLELSRQLLSAVQFLHDNDVVHDDLHAGNVLITHTDRPTVKISDFGISHELRGMTAVRPNVVHHAIMAPEILATGYTSRQSDLYQVGLLLYWMLTGESAMQMDVPYQELVRQVADGEPRQRAEQLGTPFGQLIAKMLRRREAFRYTSAREVWADLRELPAWKQRDLFPAK